MTNQPPKRPERPHQIKAIVRFEQNGQEVTPGSIRERIYQIMTERQILPDDPTYHILMGELEIVEILEDLIEKAPQKIHQALQEYQASQMVNIDRYLTDMKKIGVEDANKMVAAVKLEVMQMANQLLQSYIHEEQLQSWKKVAWPSCIAVIGILLAGIGCGWLGTVVLSPLPLPLIPGESVKLTQQQVADLKLLNSLDRQLLRDVAQYNRGQTKSCLTTQAGILRDIAVVPELGNVEYGACLFWLVPPNQRKFKQSKI
jgi:hypothetical protein